MIDHFDEAFDHVLGVEGGFSNDPKDRGGATNWGITLRTLSDFRGAPVSVSDVKNLTKEEAKEIYRKKYWEPLRCGELYSRDLALVLFDQGVNRGVGSVSRSLQEVLGVVVDGKIGSNTMAQLRKRNSQEVALLLIFSAQEHYARLVQFDHSQAKFLVGWLRRTHGLLRKMLQV